MRRTGKIEETNKGLYYRIPELTTVRLIIDERILAEKNVLLAQFGDVHPLSPQYMNGTYRLNIILNLVNKKYSLIK